MRRFHELDDREVLSLAIAIEEANAKRFETLAGLYEAFEEHVHLFFLLLRNEELAHMQLLDEEWTRRFGRAARSAIQETDVYEVIECVDLEDGEGAIFDDLDLPAALKLVERVENGAWQFYRMAAENSTNSGLKALYIDLAAMEQEHAERLLAFGTAAGGDSDEIR